MQSMCAGIDGEKEARRPLDEARIKELVRRVAGGRDAWGNSVLVGVRSTPAGLRYMLVSMGSDGRLDVDTLLRYFDEVPPSVRDDARSDIVFIDGKDVTHGGK